MTYRQARLLPTPMVLFSNRQLGRIVEWFPQHLAVNIVVAGGVMRHVLVKNLTHGKFCALSIDPTRHRLSGGRPGTARASGAPG